MSLQYNLAHFTGYWYNSQPLFMDEVSPRSKSNERSWSTFGVAISSAQIEICIACEIKEGTN